MRLIMIRNKDNERLPQSYCDFKAPGGTIGRGTDNTLILPDQTRAISRLQAMVHISPTGDTAITHRGSTTALFLNGNALAHNVQQPLAQGDILDIGGYQFSVSLQQAGVSVAPLLPSFNETIATKGIHDAVWDELEAEFLSPVPAPDQPEIHDPDHPLFIGSQLERTTKDPLAMPQESELASLQDKSNDPDHLFEQDDAFCRPTIMIDTTPSVLFMDATWDYSHEEPTTVTSAPAAQPAPELFSLADEFPTEWALNHGPASDDDNPVSLFLSNAVPLTCALDGLENFTADIPGWPSEPACQVEAAPPTLAPSDEEILQQEELAYSPTLATPDEFPSWENSRVQQERQAQPEKPADELAPKLARMGVDPIQHQPFKPARSASQEQLDGGLFSAFVAGLGLDDAPVAPDFSPEQLYLAGKLLSLFSQGTVALLSSRSILKRGLKAEMTMILEEENNPFKMLPSGKTVLMQIFSTPMPGFTPPETAVRDAMIDLQAHQLGMIAGVRAIIAAMLQTFHPDTLEKMATEQGSPKGLFSGNRKALLWDMLQRQYQQVANEVEDDFHTLFGEAFLHAYDLEIRQYKASQNRRES